jgi:MFS transporter, MHS family, shikimate and dehydroshikimate transport protein
LERIGGEHIATETPIRRVAMATLIGTTLEWYDYFIYGSLAALAFNQLFFPTLDPLVGTLAAFASFAAGFVVRPIGALVAGHYGDKIGRKTMLVVTLMTMGIATFAIGLLPVYATIGIWAPILLLAMRLIQGFGLGGEWGGAVLTAVEHAPEGRRGFYGSWPQIGVPLGLVLSTAIIFLVASLPEEAFLSWGWRVPFLLSIVLLGVGMYVRLRVEETPVFQELKETGTEVRAPFVDAIRSQPKNTLLATGARFSESVTFNVYNAFLLTYTTQQLQLETNTMLIGLMAAGILGVFVVPAAGALSDRIGRRPVYMGAAAFAGVFAFPSFWLVDTGIAPLIWLVTVLMWGVAACGMYGPQAAFFSELFDPRSRYSGISAVYQIGVLPSGAIAPAVATALLVWSGTSWPIAAYVAIIALISVVSLYFAPETYRTNIFGKQNHEREGQELREHKGSNPEGQGA